MSHNISLIRFWFVTLAFAGLLMGLPVQAQSPLDVRVLYERLDRLEAQLRDAQGAGVPAPAMPLAPEETGMEQQTLPTDVASRLQVRILQLERLVERMTGQLEQSQFELAQLRAQVQQMSNDVSYRLAVLEQAAGISSAVAMAPTAPQAGFATGPAAAPSQVPGVMAPRPAMQPQMPGQAPSQMASSGQVAVQQPETTMAQRQVLATSPSMIQPQSQVPTGRIEPDLNMPMSQPVQPQPQIMSPPPTQPTVQASDDLAGQTPAGTVMLAPGETLTAPAQTGPVNQGNTFGVVRTDAEGNMLPPAPGAATAPIQPPAPQPAAPPQIAAAPSPGPVSAAQIGTAPSPQMAMTSLPEGTPQQQYDFAFDILRRADYARAETALRMFLDANPEDTLAGNAQYWLGETYYVRGDFEQAAVEFLSGYQTYPDSNKAPDNLLKLGLSMARLGQTDGACTALSRLGNEYPDANDTIRRRAQTERARLSCS